MRLEEFQAAAADIRSDPRITALLGFNLDEGWVSVCGRDNAWQTYGLQDFSVAAYKAYRSAYRGEDSRREIFHAHLCGRELDGEGIGQDSGPMMGM